MKSIAIHSCSWLYFAIAISLTYHSTVHCSSGGNPKHRAASRNSRRWMAYPKGNFWEIPYVIEEMGANTTFQIQLAMEEMHNHTCLRFVPRKYQPFFIRFTRGLICASEITLAEECNKKGTILHEIMHAIGFYHEHSRPDRNLHIRIIEENIIPSAKFNFELLRRDEVLHYGTDYDLQSIMHYPQWAFSINGENTITGLNGEDLPKLQQAKLSEMDIYQVNKMYRCKECEDQLASCRKVATTRKCKRKATIRRACRKSCNLC